MQFNSVSRPVKEGAEKTVKAIEEGAEKTATPIVEAIRDFKEHTSLLLQKMTDAIERFEKSSTNLGRKMLWLTLVIAVLTIVMILIMIFK